MKQSFVLEIECLDTIRHSMEGEFLDEILNAFRIGLIEKFGGWQGQNCSLKVSQTVENERPSVVLKGLDWSNRNESEGLDTGDYLDDRLDEICDNK